MPTDVSQRGEMENLARSALEQFHRIDVWVNNAGVGALGPFERVPLEDHAKVIETNLLGTLYGSHLAYRQFTGPGPRITPFFDHAANYTGHEVEAPKPMHDSDNVIERIVRLARDPQDETVVGADGVVKILNGSCPAWRTRSRRARCKRRRSRSPPPAPDSPGAVQEPIARGTAVEAGRKNR